MGRLEFQKRYETGRVPGVGVLPDEITQNHYDSLGRRDTVTIMDGANAVIRLENYGYDSQNRLTSISALEGEGVIHYAYNDLGQQTDVWTHTSGAADSAAASSTWILAKKT